MHECVADPSKLPHIQCCELRGLCLVMLGSCRDVYPLTELEHKINSKQNMIMHKKWLAALCWSCEEQYHEFHHSNSIFWYQNWDLDKVLSKALLVLSKYIKSFSSYNYFSVLQFKKKKKKDDSVSITGEYDVWLFLFNVILLSQMAVNCELSTLKRKMHRVLTEGRSE